MQKPAVERSVINLTPAADVQVDRLVAGEVGYFSASIKAVADARVGDTITTRKNGSQQVSGANLKYCCRDKHALCSMYSNPDIIQ